MIEYRIASLTSASQSDADELHLSGYAALWDTPSVPLMVRGHRVIETIKRGAFTRSLAEDAQSLYWQHDTSVPLASTASGTLTLTEDERGLHYTADLPRTTRALDAIALVRAGIVTQMSFGFQARADKLDTKAGTRELHDVSIAEISLVEHGAYPQTVATSRAACIIHPTRSGLRLRLRRSITL